MKFLAIAAAAPLIAAPLLTAPAQAGPYIKGEATANFAGSTGYSNTELDMLAGYETNLSEKTSVWVEAGASFLMEEGGATDNRLKVKGGVNHAVNENLDVFGEVGFVASETYDDSHYGKVGFKYKF